MRLDIPNLVGKKLLDCLRVPLNVEAPRFWGVTARRCLLLFLQRCATLDLK